jgi:hypothetical protein
VLEGIEKRAQEIKSSGEKKVVWKKKKKGLSVISSPQDVISMSQINGLKLIYKGRLESRENFDLLSIAYSSILSEFADYRDRNKIIPIKKIYQFLGVQHHFKKEFTRELLRAMSERYPVELKQHGLKISCSSQNGWRGGFMEKIEKEYVKIVDKFASKIVKQFESRIEKIAKDERWL